MIAVHFRYPWIAPDALARLAPAAPDLVRLTELLGARPQGLPPAGRSGAALRLAAFARQPLLAEVPSVRFCERAAAFAEREGDTATLALANWAGEAAAALVRCGLTINPASAASVDRDEGERTFLENLGQTDFPTLLLWSAPEAARRHFVLEDGRPVFDPRRLASGKPRRRTLQLCLAYALGALGRTAPRGGWTGSGFGVLAQGAAAPQIDRRDERLVLEPDLAWFEARVAMGDAARVVAGESAWDHLDRRVADKAWRERLRHARDCADALGDGAWSYAASDAFLRRSEGLFATTAADPSPWWPTRVLVKELRLPASLLDMAQAAHDAARAGEAARGLTRGASSGEAETRSLPYPVRLASRRPEALLAGAEEMFDWIMDPVAAREAEVPCVGQAGAPGALVVRFDGRATAPMFIEPNPRRTSDRYAALLPGTPAFGRCDRGAVALRPPAGVVDNRLLRPAGDEIDLDQVPDGSEAVLRAALSHPALQPLLRRELASPRYAVAPDIVPLWFDRAAARTVSFGQVDEASRIWLLSADEAAALAAATRTSVALSAVYTLEVAESLGRPPFADLLIGAKRSRLPTASSLFFERLLHACRTAAGAVAVFAAPGIAAGPALLDEFGLALTCDAYLCAVDNEKAGATAGLFELERL